MDGPHDLGCCESDARQFVRGDSPYPRDMLARGRIGQGTLSWQLIALLPVLAATLSVSLARDHGCSAALTADVAGGESEIDDCEAVLHALGLVLRAAGVKCDRAVGLGEPAPRCFA